MTQKAGPCKTPALPAPWPWTSSFQNCGDRFLLVISCPVYGICFVTAAQTDEGGHLRVLTTPQSTSAVQMSPLSLPDSHIELHIQDLHVRSPLPPTPSEACPTRLPHPRSQPPRFSSPWGGTESSAFPTLHSTSSLAVSLLGPLFKEHPELSARRLHSQHTSPRSLSPPHRPLPQH